MCSKKKKKKKIHYMYRIKGGFNIPTIVKIELNVIELNLPKKSSFINISAPLYLPNHA